MRLVDNSMHQPDDPPFLCSQRMRQNGSPAGDENEKSMGKRVTKAEATANRGLCAKMDPVQGKVTSGIKNMLRGVRLYCTSAAAPGWVIGNSNRCSLTSIPH